MLHPTRGDVLGLPVPEDVVVVREDQDEVRFPGLAVTIQIGVPAVSAERRLRDRRLRNFGAGTLDACFLEGHSASSAGSSTRSPMTAAESSRNINQPNRDVGVKLLKVKASMPRLAMSAACRIGVPVCRKAVSAAIRESPSHFSALR